MTALGHDRTSRARGDQHCACAAFTRASAWEREGRSIGCFTIYFTIVGRGPEARRRSQRNRVTDATWMNAVTRRGMLLTMSGCTLIADKHGLNASPRRSAAHFNDMVEQASAAGYGDPDMTDLKISRWLGWMQGVLEAQGICTPEEIHEMSRFHKDD
jgi:hypothetical protein